MRGIGHEVPLAVERQLQSLEQVVEFADDRFDFLGHIDMHRAQVGLRAARQFLADVGQRSQSRAHAEPDDGGTGEDQQEFRQQHAEQDFADERVALDQRLGGEHGQLLVTDGPLQRRDPDRSAAQHSVEVGPPLLAAQARQYRLTRHREAGLAIEQLAGRPAHGVEDLVEFVDDQYRPGLRGQRQLGLAVRDAQLFGDGERGIEEGAVVGLGRAVQRDAVAGRRTGQEEHEQRREQPPQQPRAQASLRHRPSWPASPGSSRARAPCEYSPQPARACCAGARRTSRSRSA